MTDAFISGMAAKSAALRLLGARSSLGLQGSHKVASPGYKDAQNKNRQEQ